MSRISPLGAPYPQDVQTAFDRIMGPGVPPLVLFSTLAKSERAWRKFMGGSLLDGSVLTLRQRELVINRVCARTGCEYEWGVHVLAFSKGAGLSKEDIAETLRYPLNGNHWPADEAALLSTIDSLHDRSTLSDAEFELAREHLNEEQILEVMMLAGFYHTVSYIANGLNLPLEKHAARFSAFAPT